MNLFKYTMWLLAAACFSVALAAEKAPAAGENPDEEFDTVVVTSGPVFPPTHVTDDNYVYVIGKTRVTIKKEAYLVKDIVYADKSASYSRAVEKRDEGRYTLAALYFSNALEEMKDVKWAKEYCNYGIACAFYSFGVFDGYKGRTRTYEPAAEYFKRVLEANPKSRFMLDVVTKLPVCYAEQGKIAEADASLKAAAESIKKYTDDTGKLGPGYSEPAERANVQLAIAKAKLVEKQATSAKDNGGLTIANARDLWHDARARAKKFSDLLSECVDGELRCMIANKQYDEAKAQASDLVTRFSRDNEYNLLSQLPAAYIALGQANFEQAREYVKKGNKPLANGAFAEARWAFLNVIAQFFDNEEYVAFAHYMAGICYDQLKDQEPEDAEKKAIREWNTVVVSFPKSPYRKMATDRLKEHGVNPDEAGKPTPAAVQTAPATPAPTAPATPPKAATPPKPAPAKPAQPKAAKPAEAKPAAKPATAPATTPSTTEKKK